jgi:glycosyltransferase involved in cell wall biosynthesis
VTAANSIEELLSLYDEAFVRCAYATVLGRDPDPGGFKHYLSRIRSGESRHAILAEIRLSPEGGRRHIVLPGLERVVRPYRWRRLPLLGPILGLLGVGRERIDVRRQLAVIEKHLQQLEGRVSADAAATTAPPGAAPAAAPPASEQAPVRRTVPLTLTWRVQRSANESEALTLVRDEIARGLAELRVTIVPGAVADVTALFAPPPLLAEPRGGATMLVGHDWEEGGYPVDWVDGLNGNLAGIACASSHAAKILIDHGVDVPVVAVGLGVDHLERIFASPDYRAPGKKFRFLHVSSCDPGKGLDLLLASFGRMFDSDNDVSLIIRPAGATPRELVELLGRLRNANPRFPDVVLVEGSLPAGDLKALYQQCDVFVAPSRAEGFGLHIAQAMLCGLPVVATAWGGHCDYCDETSSWLVDYRFERARTPNDLIVSAWVEPEAKSLDDALRAAYRARPAERSARAASGRKRLLDSFAWKEVARRLALMAARAKAGERGKKDVAGEPRKSRVGWVTTWNVKCGVAHHVADLLDSLPEDEHVIFAARQEPRIGADKPNCLRIWNVDKESNGLDAILPQLASWSVDILVIQFNYGFYNHRELNEFIEAVADRGVVVMVDMHSTVDPFGGKNNFRLAEFLDGLRRCRRILAHAPADLTRLKALGLVDNVMLFPLGLVNKGQASLPRRNTPPLIASFGFCFPNKGLPELVEAVSLLKREGNPVRLLMLNAEAPHPLSAPVALEVREAIARFGVQDCVELRTEFLEDEACLALMGEAELLVNPYQKSGESASSAVRYALTSGRPVAVTPLPLFEDLGGAVFRMPGLTPQAMARGIAEALKHLEEQSAAAAGVREAARRWVEEHDYRRQSVRLMRTARTLMKTRKVARGVFINTAQASCSIFESGRMVYNCIRESEHHTLDYFSLDMLDVAALAGEGRIKPLKPQAGMPEDPGEYDFWVFNWHFVTMASHLDPESIRRLPGRKFTVVLELEPSDPLKLVPPGVFDGYIALDPSAPTTNAIFPFPRPLEGDPRDPASPARAVPVIGSFGFGTPSKGFELLVEAANREFDRAVVRINIPYGTHVGPTDAFHGQDYAKYIAALCKRIAKPGIDVRFTYDYMSPEQLIDWCGDNDLNCFMYTRRQSGLSATTDQAIMSGRPLLTSSNDTFRHIHRYIPPYPVMGLREAIETTTPQVRKMQREWSRNAFGETFLGMLGKFGLIARGSVRRNTSAQQDERLPTIVVASQARPNPTDIFWYPTRVADCLSRSGKYQVERVDSRDLAELQAQISRLRPSAVIALEFPGAGREALAAALKGVAGPRILLEDGVQHSTRTAQGLFVLPRQPVIPYFTSSGRMRTGVPGIWLFGFAARDSNLEEVVAKIARELPQAELLLEVPERQARDFKARFSRLRESLAKADGLRMAIHTPPMSCGPIVANVLVNNLSIFYNDPDRTQELESASCIAMVTERPLAFTRAAPFPQYRGHGTYVEDVGVADLLGMGMGAQIKLCHEFGEGQLYARIHLLLSDELAGAQARELPAESMAAE